MTTCVQRVWSRFGLRSYSCGRNAKVERNGEWYCGTHDPVARKARRDAKDKAWREKWDARNAVVEQARMKREADEARLGKYDALAKEAGGAVSQSQQAAHDDRIVRRLIAIGREAPDA